MIKVLLIFVLIAPAYFGQVPNELVFSFGDSGTVQLDIDDLDHLTKIRIDQSDIYFAGHTGYFDTILDYDLIICKTDSMGSLDTSFADQGISRFDFPGKNHSVIYDLEINENGLHFIGTGLNHGDVDTLQVFIGKLNFDGSVDSSFATNGFYSPSINGTYDSGYDIELLDNGMVLFCGSTTNNSTNLEHPMIGRLQSNGVPDSTFGGTGLLYWSWDGTITSALNTLEEKHGDGGYLTGVTLVGDKYFFQGHYIANVNPMCLMMMLNEDGTLCNDYAGLGYRVFELAPNFSNYLIKTRYVNNKLITLMDIAGTYEGKVVLYQQDTNGIHLQTNEIEIQGNTIDPVGMIVANDNSLAITGYIKDQNASSLIRSEYQMLLETDGDGIRNNDFCTNGLFENSPIQEESGIYDLFFDGEYLWLGGYVNPDNQTNDITISKLQYNPTLIIKENNNKHSIYPNPTNDWLHINGEIRKATVQIIGIDGKITDEQNGKSSIYVGDLPSGVYFLLIKTANETTQYKFIRN